MNTELVVSKENIFTKIRKFFLKMFGQNIENKEKTCENINVQEKKSNFMDNIKIEDNEEQRILKLQQDYKAGKILEENMMDEDHRKLIELYKQQNSELREKIENKKNYLRKKINDL